MTTNFTIKTEGGTWIIAMIWKAFLNAFILGEKKNKIQLLPPKTQGDQWYQVSVEVSAQLQLGWHQRTAEDKDCCSSCCLFVKVVWWGKTKSGSIACFRHRGGVPSTEQLTGWEGLSDLPFWPAVHATIGFLLGPECKVFVALQSVQFWSFMVGLQAGLSVATF